MAGARALDAEVLEHDDRAEPDGAGCDDARGEGAAQSRAPDDRQQRGRRGEPRHGEPARTEPLERHLRERHGEAPQDACGEHVDFQPGNHAPHAGRPAAGPRHDLARVLPCLERRAHPPARPRTVRLLARECHLLSLGRRRLHAVLRTRCSHARRAHGQRARRAGQRGRHDQHAGPAVRSPVQMSEYAAVRRSPARRRSHRRAATFISYYTYGAGIALAWICRCETVRWQAHRSTTTCAALERHGKAPALRAG